MEYFDIVAFVLVLQTEKQCLIHAQVSTFRKIDFISIVLLFRLRYLDIFCSMCIILVVSQGAAHFNFKLIRGYVCKVKLLVTIINIVE